jgi:protein SCO1/2
VIRVKKKKAQPKTKFLALLVAFLAGSLTLVAALIMVMPHRVTQPSSVGGPFTLTDQNGNIVTDATFKGEPFLVFFGFTHCPDVCPTTLYEMSEVLNRLGPDANKTAALFVTVDPERDTPEKLKQYISSFHPRIFGLTGTEEQIDAIKKEYRVFAKKVPTKDGDYTMDHTAVVYLMDKNGRFVAPFNLSRSADEAAADLRKRL